MTNKKRESSAGKGDSPRNCQSPKYRNNYSEVKWKSEQKKAK